ncbi:venom allergen 3 homolog [Scaptodrosophila lebanonensis]|uniref:Venom allergen-1 n=1 Tax=Drosophila lebanonensis TaxID=7225 RepID=A0A6J2TWC8_DROLE|nr:venom allergen 3 homolog [Scaptodrosophila lebanonensis]
MRIILTITLVLLLDSCQAQDYCNAKLCPNKRKHIACKNKGSFASTCPEDAKLLSIDADNQNLLLQLHNNLRHKLAGGYGKVRLTACRMATMQWSPELARLAELNVKQCEMAHDGCRGTARFQYAGQNIYQARYSRGPFPKVDNLLRTGFQNWVSEESKTEKDQLKSYPRYNSGPAIGHFTVIANERNVAVGCALAKYRKGSWTTFLMTCNYAVTNMVDYPVYSDCKKPATKCKTGTNPNYSALCSVREKVDYNFQD